MFNSRENKKECQREVLWQQVENLAKTKTEWVNATGKSIFVTDSYRFSTRD